ncbi:hypothetical protein K458DRAFT_355487 [Lentithecium fluviatile CBS 122367]|uniref:Uncharacterized protein n=1 Tax=Lentithecium fluviatile CBS 122367 TaxID=1168545 RepID=A0A6G1JKG5_9PLEO|nr:hypothetical protein K458DRAFT_355487 [Lentithecium fluviatile CBS 122367]
MASYRGRGFGLRPSGNPERKRNICHFFRDYGRCKFGTSCKFSHDLSGLSPGVDAKPTSAPAVSDVEARYRRWRNILKKFFGPQDRQRLWAGALDILNGDDRELKQKVAQDLNNVNDDKESGLRQVKNLVESRAQPGQFANYVLTCRDFLLVMTHHAFLDSLSLDTHVGALYSIIAGANGDRAVPFLQHLCEVLGTVATDESFPNSREAVESTLIGVAIALCELLKRQSRARFNNELPALVASLENTTEIATSDTPSITGQLVAKHIEDMRASIARAHGLLIEPTGVETDDTLIPQSAYPRGFEMPRDRHDNDKIDITKMIVFPTRQEIMSDVSEFLPSTDLDQPHYLTDKAERHVDTHFRLLRRDTFGELKEALANLMDSIAKDPVTLRNTKLEFDNMRAYSYIDSCIDRVTFRRKGGLQAQFSFLQPPSARKKSAADNQRWWEDSRRLTDGVLLSFIWVTQTGVQHVFLTAMTVSNDATPVKEDSTRKTVWTRLTTRNESNVAAFVDLSCSKTNGILLEFPNILPGTFVPVLENLQNMQRQSRLPFRQWILPDRSDNKHLSIPLPLYARGEEFRFSLRSIQRPGDVTLYIYPWSSSDDSLLINQMVASTGLDDGQCRAMVAALTREFAFIQGPPGTGKSYLGIKLLQILMDIKTQAKLGPIIIVCYTNHALDQFLEHLIKNGIRKIIRMGSRSRSEMLEGHNLRKVSQTETKTRSEKKQTHDAYAALNDHETTINCRLSQVHGMQRRLEWEDLDDHLSFIYPEIHNQFDRTDEDGFITVGRHPFEIWRGNADPRGGHASPRAMRIDALIQKATANVNNLSYPERCLLVEHWAREVQEEAKAQLFDCVREAEATQGDLRNVHEELNRRVLQNADVIGLTTTGLAKDILTLQRVRCKVVICEEAGEVMEPHMLSAMLPTVEHCIQIGDHEQLRPTINNHNELSLETPKGQNYQLDRSQFERLSVGQRGRPSVPVVQLNVQRRMRSDISTLIRETIYPKLVDHDSTKSLSDVVGMRSNVFWLDHTNQENKRQAEVHHQKSKSNDWEVKMVHALVRHIVRQGIYDRSDIAVLTPYTGQLQKLRAVMRNDFEIVISERDEDALAQDGFTINENSDNNGDVGPQQEHRKKPLEKKKLSDLLRLATVDNFQGEEAKIVIVSLVRSNDNRKVGFLKTTNRINVLLSRAQHGMFLIGNTDTYSDIPMWEAVIDMLRAKNCVGTSMGLCCPRHPDTVISVQRPDDFAVFSPEGGCREPCQDRLPECGHRCQSRCHSTAMHDVWKCERPCERRHETCEHPCQKATCGEDCGNCRIILHNVQLPCGHTKNNVSCHLTQQMDRIVCNSFVEKVVPGCSHTVSIRCAVDVTAEHYRCPARCGTYLPCGHACPGTCGNCNIKGNDGEPMVKHPKCTKACGRRFGACNHTCPKACHNGQDCGLCLSNCEVRCKHSQCKLKCHEACAPCVEVCTWSCVHQGDCTMPCSAPCNRLPCDERCTKKLPCGHRCPGLCGENCPEDYCQACGMKNDAQVDVLEFKTYGEINLDDTPVLFLNCGHFFTAETLDGNVGLQEVYEVDNKTGEICGLKDMSTQLAKSIPFCPNCRTPIRQYATQRYNRLINRAVIDEMSKRFIVSGQAELQGLEERLLKLEKDLERTRATVTTPPLLPLTIRNEDRDARELTSRLQARYKAAGQLQADIIRFQKRVANRHQPAHKLHEATIHAMKRDRNATLDSALAALSLRESTPTTERDHRITSGGQMVLLKADCVSLEDKFRILSTLISKYPKTSPSVRLTGHSPLQLTRPFLQKCAQFVADCDAKSLPKLAVEVSLYYARIARLYETSRLTAEKDRAKATMYHNEAKALLARAQELCKREFRDAETLLQAVNESIKLLQKEWYEEVTAEELAAIKAAMVSGSDSIATHSGHWYNCENGHPFAIGECGMPMELARCPECGARIGGQSHTAVEGVTRAENMEH